MFKGKNLYLSNLNPEVMKLKIILIISLALFTSLKLSFAQAPDDLKDETILVVTYQKLPEMQDAKGMQGKLTNKGIRTQNSKVEMNNKYQDKYMQEYPFKFRYITPIDKANGNYGDAKYIFSWDAEMLYTDKMGNTTTTPSMQDVIAQQRKGNFASEKDYYYTYKITNLKTNEAIDIGAKKAREQVHALKMAIEAVKKQFNK